MFAVNLHLQSTAEGYRVVATAINIGGYVPLTSFFPTPEEALKALGTAGD